MTDEERAARSDHGDLGWDSGIGFRRHEGMFWNKAEWVTRGVAGAEKRSVLVRKAQCSICISPLGRPTFFTSRQTYINHLGVLQSNRSLKKHLISPWFSAVTWQKRLSGGKGVELR